MSSFIARYGLHGALGHNPAEGVPDCTRNGLIAALKEPVFAKHVSEDSLTNHARRASRKYGHWYELILEMEWPRLMVFLERVYARALERDAATALEAEINDVFDEDGLPYRMKEGLIERMGFAHTEQQAARARFVLQRPELANARTCYNDALAKFHAKDPDLEGCVLKAVQAIEACARALFTPGAETGLETILLKNRAGNDQGQIPHTLAKAIVALYTFRGAAERVAHAGGNGPEVNAASAEYVLAASASAIIYLVGTSDTAPRAVPI